MHRPWKTILRTQQNPNNLELESYVLAPVLWGACFSTGISNSKASDFSPVKPYSDMIMFLIIEMAAAAKSLQSCPTLCDPIDGSPPGSPVPGILQAKHWSGLPFLSPMHESEK